MHARQTRRRQLRFGITGAAIGLAIAASPLGAQMVVQSGRGMEIGDIMGASSAARPLEVGTGVVVGRVNEADNRGPVSGAIVTLTMAGFTPLRALTDGQGRFAFRALPQGRYSLTAVRPGFVDGALGRMRPGGTPQPLELGNNQRTDAVTILMWRHAAISGTVLDENNEPLVGAPVRALRRDYVAGRRQLTDVGSDNTDDRGQYRIGSLEPGEYVIVLPVTKRPSIDAMLDGLRSSLPAGGRPASVFAVRMESTGTGSAPMVFTTSSDDGVPDAGTDENGFPLTYQTEYFTGALSASQATAIPLEAGDDRAGVDFRLTPVRSLSVSGTVIGPDGPAANVQIQLIPSDAQDLVSPIETASTSTDGSGRFEFTGVPAGQYKLVAQRTPRFAGGGGRDMSFTSAEGGRVMITREVVVGRLATAAELPDQPTLWAEVPVAVSQQSLAELTVPLQEGLKVSGTVSFLGSAEQPTAEARSGISISLEPADGRTAGLTSVARGRVDETGTFTTIGVPAGKYVLRVSGAPQGWSLRSALFGGRDITESAVTLAADSATGVALTFTDRPSSVNGNVRDALGNADATASVVLFPVDPARWVDTGSQPRRLQSVRVGQDGSFTVPEVPPGEYHVIALSDSAPRSWQAPTYLQELARSAQQIRVGDGETRTVSLTSMKGPA